MFIFFDVVFFFFFLCKPVFDTVFFFGEKFRIVISKRLMLGAANILGGGGAITWRKVKLVSA